MPLLDAGLAGLVNVAQNALVTGGAPERHGNAHPNIVPYQDFETASGRIAVAAANDGLFGALCRVLELEELPREPSATARVFRFRDGQGEIGFINPVSEPFCSDCNRIRLTSAVTAAWSKRSSLPTFAPRDAA